MELLTETVPNEDLKVRYNYEIIHLHDSPNVRSSNYVYVYFLQKFEKIYHEQLYKNDISTKAQFEYAWCLVRSKYPADIRKGIVLLQELFKTHEEGRRDYLYYLAIGNARLREYKKALDYVKLFLEIEPGNQT